MDIQNVLDEIANLPDDWHGAGTVTHGVLEEIANLHTKVDIFHSIETGSGKTTLLLSHMSKHHTVFAVDAGRSISAVRESELFSHETTHFVEGPTQKTLPTYSFEDKLDLVLIDGPHGYPFPDLEYYYLYPCLKEGGFLLLDDIHIPTIYNLFQFLCEDDMFELEGVRDQTAFFRRTSAPLFHPFQDGWWLQNYNKTRFPLDIEKLRSFSELDTSSEERFENLTKKLKRTRKKNKQLKQEVELLEERIQAMEQSKFWKLRQAWFSIRGKI